MGWDLAGAAVAVCGYPTRTDAVIGYCGFFYHYEHGIEDIEIGYRLNPDYWNRGLMTENCARRA